MGLLDYVAAVRLLGFGTGEENLHVLVVLMGGSVTFGMMALEAGALKSTVAGVTVAGFGQEPVMRD